MTVNPTQRAIDSLIRHASPDLQTISFAIAIFDLALIRYQNDQLNPVIIDHLVKVREILSSYLEVLDHD